MKILYVHNDYARPSGEENAAESIVALLKEHGHEVRWFRRSSAELQGLSGKIKGFFTGIANPAETCKLGRVLDEYQPDVVQVQNVYPLFSPSVFPEIKKRHIPVIMRCPNYRLFCPNGLCCDWQGNVCELCFGGHEWHCAVKKCAGGTLKSAGYALRGVLARITRKILDNVDMFIVQTEFQKQKFISQGIPAEKLGILPGIMKKMEAPAEWTPGKYITFVGRVSSEKGIEEFVECARRLPEIPFLVAGAYDDMLWLKESSPANIEWRGFVKGEALRQTYIDSRIIVISSRCYEGFPNVIVQSMQMERPVAAVDLGASGAVVKDGVTGIKFQAGNVADMVQKLQALYGDENRCCAYGKAGALEALNSYSPERIYQKWKAIYEEAKRFNSLSSR